MSCSRPLPPFVCDSLYYLNRDQLERFSIVCRPLKNFIKRYFHSKPYRIFDRLWIRGGSYTLLHTDVHWHPNRDDYSVQQVLAGQKCSIKESKVPCNIHSQIHVCPYYSFAEMHPYLGPNVRIEAAIIVVAGSSTYNPSHIAEMESIAYLWRNHYIVIWNADKRGDRIVAEDFQPILNSPTILQCHTLGMINACFPFKEYKVLFTVKVILLNYDGDDATDSNYWGKFLEQPGNKPIVVLHYRSCENIDTALDCLKEAFSSAVLPTAFKIVFHAYHDCEHLIEFREINNISNEKLELKKVLSVDNYTLERSII